MYIYEVCFFFRFDKCSERVEKVMNKRWKRMMVRMGYLVEKEFLVNILKWVLLDEWKDELCR